MMGDRTPRGFRIYCELTDTYGAVVRVQESSSAEGRRAWIMASWPAPYMHLGQADRAALAAAGFGTELRLAELAAKLEPSPHLDVEQARELRDALDAFIQDAS